MSVSLYAADITLADDTPPTASSVGGSLTAGGTLSGVQDISFSAADTGSGLYEAVFSIDGHAVSTQLLESGSGPCRSVGGTSDGSNAFFEVEPCPLALSDDLSFDTALAPEGSHLLTVQLLDAAGNATTILNRQVTFANHAASVPAGAAIGPGSPARAARPGQRHERLRSGQAHGALDRYGEGGADEPLRAGRPDHGASDCTRRLPISGALLDVYETPAYEGARTVPLAGRAHRADGRLDPDAAPGHSSECAALRLPQPRRTTRSPSPRPPSRCGCTPGSRCGSRREVTSVGDTIVFSGTLHGAPIPPGGKQLVLEASSGGEWIQFRTIGTDAKGRYRASYRFKFPGPVIYRFRVFSPHEADFPFFAGTSNVVDVYER